MNFSKLALAIMLATLFISLFPLSNAQQSQSYVTYHVELKKVTNSTYYNTLFDISFNETFSSSQINATTYNNTISVIGTFLLHSSVFNLSYLKPFKFSTSYKSKHSLINEILSLNLTKVLNFTVEVFKKVSFDNLLYVKNITYKPNGTLNVNFQGSTYTVNSYVLKGNVTFSLSYKNSIIEFTKLDSGRVLLFNNGLLYIAEFSKNATSNVELSTKYFNVNYTKQSNKVFIIQLVSTNLSLPKDAPSMVQYLLMSIPVVAFVGIITAFLYALKKSRFSFFKAFHRSHY